MGTPSRFQLANRPLEEPEDLDATAQRWDRAYEEHDLYGHRRRARLAATVRLIGHGPGDALDVGAGSGRLLAALDERGWTVFGVDASPPMVELAHARLPHATERLTVARAEELPFPNGAFDVVAVISVLEYTDMEVAVRELVRVLRPGGRAVIGLRSRLAPTTVWRRGVVRPLVRGVNSVIPVGRPLMPPLRRPLGRKQATRLLTAAGLVVDRVEPVGAMVIPDPLDHVAPGLAYRAARWAERSDSLRRVFGTQSVILARKP